MTVHPNANAETAMQYLVWALEDIEKAGNQKAGRQDHCSVTTAPAIVPGGTGQLLDLGLGQVFPRLDLGISGVGAACPREANGSLIPIASNIIGASAS